MNHVQEQPALRSVLSAMPPYRPGRRASSARTASLAANESHFEPLPSVQEAIRRAASAANRYPDAACTQLRHAIAEHLSAELPATEYHAVTPDQIAVSPGSVGAIQQLMATFCDAGDEVVFAWRSFEAYPLLTRLAGAQPVPVPLTPELGHDLDAMLKAITERTRIVLLCVPNNPTGTGLDPTALAAFLDQVPPTVLVVLDEAYAEYTSPVGLLNRRANVCVLRTFSKAYGLAGLRVGYAVTSEMLADGLRQTALPFGVSSIAQEAAIASLSAREELRERVEAIVRERNRMLAAVRELGWWVPDSQANFLWLPGSVHLLEAFGEADILVRPFADEGLRITLADRATNDRVLDVLAGPRC
ncbi:histidinol-phosphate transaminase [Kineosporia babensis]|uniref:Histidinol-phosphate aminotransferase n=1 Tax=Kineosporia babensis TaxID=499548 RepID=A0A9X1T466_9ACTN|nr:histidinol-phosphate transaminase [Kineosporia babensis]MCD5316453.1 histidinol-phosphate transaminase [Kineosporia babensis]